LPRLRIAGVQRVLQYFNALRVGRRHTKRRQRRRHRCNQNPPHNLLLEHLFNLAHLLLDLTAEILKSAFRL
jgi:hypothetical protein